jgi:1-acyl-sn-glycerol-3-phosphate acyltransferase
MSKINRFWRLLATAFSIFVFAVGAVLLALLLAPAIHLLRWPEARRRQLARSSIQRCVWCYVRMLRGLGLFTFEFQGEEQLNQPGVLVVANHPTLIDAVLLMSEMPNATFIVKAAMARNPITRWIVALAGYIPNDEVGVELVEKATLALGAGETLMIFPEGTRSEGDELTLKRGAANIALAANCTMIPVVLRCNPITLRKGDAWYHLPSRPPHFVLRVLSPIVPAELVSTGQPPGLQARALTGVLRDRFVDELQKPW